MLANVWGLLEYMFGAGASPHIYANIAVVFWWHYHHLRPLSPSLSIQQLLLRPPALPAVVVNVQSGEWASEGGGNICYLYLYLYIHL